MYAYSIYLIAFSFYAINAETKKPMHREVGFIRVTPDLSKVAFVSAQNTGEHCCECILI